MPLGAKSIFTFEVNFFTSVPSHPFNIMAANLASFAVKAARNGVQKTITSNLNTSARRSASQMHPSVKAKQDTFNAPNDTPIYIKGGPLDAAMFGFTAFCCVTSLSLIGYNLFVMANKK